MEKISKYYRPGLISLVFLPFLFIPFVKNAFHERDLRIIKFNLPEECANIEGKFCNEDVYASNEVDYLLYSSLNDSEIENFFSHLAQLSKDSLWLKTKPSNYQKAYVLTFTDSITYGEIVKLLSLCLKHEIIRYQLDIYKSNFVISGLYNYQSDREFGSFIEFCSVINMKAEPTIYQKAQSWVLENSGISFTSETKAHFLVLGLYFGLCAVSFVRGFIVKAKRLSD